METVCTEPRLMSVLFRPMNCRNNGGGGGYIVRHYVVELFTWMVLRQERMSLMVFSQRAMSVDMVAVSCSLLVTCSCVCGVCVCVVMTDSAPHLIQSRCETRGHNGREVEEESVLS